MKLFCALFLGCMLLFSENSLSSDVDFLIDNSLEKEEKLSLLSGAFRKKDFTLQHKDRDKIFKLLRDDSIDSKKVEELFNLIMRGDFFELDSSFYREDIPKDIRLCAVEILVQRKDLPFFCEKTASSILDILKDDAFSYEIRMDLAVRLLQREDFPQLKTFYSVIIENFLPPSILREDSREYRQQCQSERVKNSFVRLTETLLKRDDFDQLIEFHPSILKLFSHPINASSNREMSRMLVKNQNFPQLEAFFSRITEMMSECGDALLDRADFPHLTQFHLPMISLIKDSSFEWKSSDFLKVLIKRQDLNDLPLFNPFILLADEDITADTRCRALKALIKENECGVKKPLIYFVIGMLQDSLVEGCNRVKLARKVLLQENMLNVSVRNFWMLAEDQTIESSLRCGLIADIINQGQNIPQTVYPLIIEILKDTSLYNSHSLVSALASCFNPDWDLLIQNILEEANIPQEIRISFIKEILKNQNFSKFLGVHDAVVNALINPTLSENVRADLSIEIIKRPDFEQLTPLYLTIVKMLTSTSVSKETSMKIVKELAARAEIEKISWDKRGVFSYLKTELPKISDPRSSLDSNFALHPLQLLNNKHISNSIKYELAISYLDKKEEKLESIYPVILDLLKRGSIEKDKQVRLATSLIQHPFFTDFSASHPIIIEMVEGSSKYNEEVIGLAGELIQNPNFLGLTDFHLPVAKLITKISRKWGSINLIALLLRRPDLIELRTFHPEIFRKIKDQNSSKQDRASLLKGIIENQNFEHLTEFHPEILLAIRGKAVDSQNAQDMVSLLIKRESLDRLPLFNPAFLLKDKTIGSQIRCDLAMFLIERSEIVLEDLHPFISDLLNDKSVRGWYGSHPRIALAKILLKRLDFFQMKKIHKGIKSLIKDPSIASEQSVELIEKFSQHEDQILEFIKDCKLKSHVRLKLVEKLINENQKRIPLEIYSTIMDLFFDTSIAKITRLEAARSLVRRIDFNQLTAFHPIIFQLAKENKELLENFVEREDIEFSSPLHPLKILRDPTITPLITADCLIKFIKKREILSEEVIFITLMFIKNSKSKTAQLEVLQLLMERPDFKELSVFHPETLNMIKPNNDWQMREGARRLIGSLFKRRDLLSLPIFNHFNLLKNLEIDNATRYEIAREVVREDLPISEEITPILLSMIQDHSLRKESEYREFVTTLINRADFGLFPIFHPSIVDILEDKSIRDDAKEFLIDSLAGREDLESIFQFNALKYLKDKEINSTVRCKFINRFLGHDGNLDIISEEFHPIFIDLLRDTSISQSERENLANILMWKEGYFFTLESQEKDEATLAYYKKLEHQNLRRRNRFVSFPKDLKGLIQNLVREKNKRDAEPKGECYRHSGYKPYRFSGGNCPVCSGGGWY